MAKKALIAEPDPGEARKQAAILTDAGYVVSLLDGSDVIGAIESSPPDVVVLRHERPGQSGLAIVGRLKRQGIATASAIVLTSTDLTPEAVRRHESQRFAADAYVRLPVSRKDLIAAAASVPEILDAAEVAHEIPRPPPRPGKTPAMHSRPVAHLPGGNTEAPLALSDNDLKFVEDVFSSITTGVGEHDATVPIPPPKVDAHLSGPDRKMALLKQSLYQREEEIARLKRVWKRRDEQFSEAQATFAAKDVEVAGLKLRIEEQSAAIEQAQLELERRTEEFGRNIGAQYDEASLREAEMIQEVAKKEDELNRLRRTLRKTEDDKAENEATLKQHIFDWEKAYKAFEEHHRQVVLASLREVQRLETTIASRSGKTAAYAHRLREREEELARSLAALVVVRQELMVSHHARHEEVQRALYNADQLLVVEKHQRRLAEDLVRDYAASTNDLEQQVYRLDRLLWWRDRKAIADVTHIAGHARAFETERDHLLDERGSLVQEREALESTLSTERAYGEAAIARLLSRESRTARIDNVRLSHRHALIVELEATRDTHENEIEVLTRQRDTSRGDVEVEKDRNRDLDEVLAETRVRLAESNAALESTLEKAERDLAATTEQLHGVEGILAQTVDELGTTRTQGAQFREEAVKDGADKDAAIKSYLTRIAEFERDLQASREDVGTQRQTVAARDERIGELLAKVREVDALNVSLEGQTDRLRTEVAEGGAELEVLREQTSEKTAVLHRRDDELSTLAHELDAAHSETRRQQTLVEEGNKTAADLERDLASEKADVAETKKALITKDEEFHAQAQVLAQKESDLGEARAEIVAGVTILEEVQNATNLVHQRADQLREKIRDDEVLLTAAEERANANHDARLSLDVSLEEERAALDTARAELANQRRRAEESETRFTALDEAQHQLRKGATKVQKELVAMSEVKRRLEEKVEEMGVRVDASEQSRLSALNERNQQSAKAAEEHERLLVTESERARLEAESARQQEKIAQIEVALEQAQGEISQAAQTTSGDVAALEAERVARAALENDRNEARQHLAELTARLQQAEQATVDATSRATEIATHATAQGEETEVLRSDLHGAQKRHDEIVAAMEKEHSLAIRSAQERDAIAQDRDIAQQHAAVVEKELSDLREQVTTLRSAVGAADAFEERTRRMAQALSGAKASVDDEKSRRVAAEALIENLKKSLGEQREDTLRLEQALETQSRSLASKTNAAQVAARKLQALEAQAGQPSSTDPSVRLRAELSEAQQTSAMYAGEVAQLRQEVNELQASLSLNQSNPNEDTLEKWKSAAVASSEESALATERATEAETRLAHAQQQLSRLSSAYDGARRRLEELDQR